MPSAPASDGGWGVLPGLEDGGFGDTWQGGETKGQKSVIDRLRQEWEVYVIQDDETPNAFVTGGTAKSGSPSFEPSADVLFNRRRQDFRFHGHFTYRKER